MNDVARLTRQLEQKLILYRRDFHKYAESAWTEFRTASLIARRLTELGYLVKLGPDVIRAEDRMGVPPTEILEQHFQRALEQGADPELAAPMRGGFTGVVGELRCGCGPTVALRFDIDAVEMTESSDPQHRPVQEGFASVNPEAMHSCGHDGHAAIGLGVAEVVAQLCQHLKLNVKLIFQPAEEGVRGAKAMVGAGVLDDVDYVMALHLASGRPLGSVACGGETFLATSKFDAILTGAPAHAGGSPEKGKNAMLAAAAAVLNLYAISRHSGGPTRINVGRMNAGTGRNVIPAEARLAIETRGTTTELNDYMYQRAVQILKGAADMYQCGLSIEPMGSAPSAASDQQLIALVKEAAQSIEGFTEVIDSSGLGGSEDFTYMMKRVQERGGMATFLQLGADLGGWGHHTEYFDFDEKALIKGVELLVTTLLLISDQSEERTA